MIAVTFDVGQTLLDLDHALLARQAAARGVSIDPVRTEAASAGAWRAYDAAKLAGKSGPLAWSAFMTSLLEQAGVPASRGAELVAFLWEQQPACNLWRRPIAGMVDLAGDLSRAGVPVGVISNSEGRVADLLAEVGALGPFRVVVDSGRLGFEKPDVRIFEHAAQSLGVAIADLVHVGDSWEADVQGVIDAGGRAIWLTASGADHDRVRAAHDAAGVRAVLRGWHVAGA